MKAKTIQKLIGIVLILMGILVAIIADGDCTILIIASLFGIPMIASDENLIGLEDYIEEGADNEE